MALFTEVTDLNYRIIFLLNPIYLFSSIMLINKSSRALVVNSLLYQDPIKLCNEKRNPVHKFDSANNIMYYFYGLVHLLDQYNLYHELGIDVAAGSGHTNILDWSVANIDKPVMQKQKRRTTKLKFLYTKDAIDWAAESGHVKVLEWFRLHPCFAFKYTNRAIDLAANAGHVPVLEWFLEQSRSADITFMYTNTAIDLASAHNHINVLDWFRFHPEIAFKYTKAAVNNAARNGYVAVLE